MPEVVTEIDVDASPARCWAVLVDFPRYAEWNPVIGAIDGAPEIGSRLALSLRMGGGRVVRAKATIERCETERELAWRGGVRGARWLVDVLHAFRLLPLEGDRTRLVHSERFDGLAPLLLWPILGRLVKPRYPLANEAFKRRCEGDA